MCHGEGSAAERLWLSVIAAASRGLPPALVKTSLNLTGGI